MSGRHKPGFTPTQGQYLAFIDAYMRVNLKPPAEADIQRRFGVTPPSVHQMVLALERAGLIRRQPGASRSIEVLVPPEAKPTSQNLCAEVLVGTIASSSCRTLLASERSATTKRAIRASSTIVFTVVRFLGFSKSNTTGT